MNRENWQSVEHIMGARARLRRIDLTKAKKHECPGIKTGAKYTYLCLIYNSYHAGYFNRQWYGLNFVGWCGSSIQFDAPGSNSSSWKAVWRIENR